MSTATHGYNNTLAQGKPYYNTVHRMGSGKTGQNVVLKSLAENTALPVPVVSITSRDKNKELIIEITGHGAKVGDICRFYSGALRRHEYDIIEVIDANSFVIQNIGGAPLVGDTAKIMFYVTSKSDSEGNVNFSPGPTQFIHNAVSTQVEQDDVTPANNKPLPTGLYYYKDGVIIPVRRDTVTPSNNAPLPVELIGFDGGTINITAGDINVQLSDMGATFDSARIGDGSGFYLAINADGSINVQDAAALAELQNIITELQALNHAQGTDGAASTAEMIRVGGTDGVNDQIQKMTADGRAEVVVMESVLPTGAATEADQDITNAHLSEIEGAVETLESVVGTDGIPAPATGLMIGGVDAAGDFQRVGVNAAGELLVNMSTGAGGLASEATLDEMNNKFNQDFGAPATGIRTASQIGNATGAADFNAGADGAQTLRVSANLKRAGNELSYNAGAADANTLRMALATGHGLATQVTLAALEAKLGTLGQKASAGSAPMVLSTEQEAILERIADAVEASTVLAPTYQEDTAVDDVTVGTFVAPAGAKWCKIMADDTNNGNVRVKLGGAATTTSGMQFQPGRSEDFQVAGNISYVMEAAGTGKLYVIFGA